MLFRELVSRNNHLQKCKHFGKSGAFNSCWWEMRYLCTCKTTYALCIIFLETFRLGDHHLVETVSAASTLSQISSIFCGVSIVFSRLEPYRVQRLRAKFIYWSRNCWFIWWCNICKLTLKQFLDLSVEPCCKIMFNNSPAFVFFVYCIFVLSPVHTCELNVHMYGWDCEYVLSRLQTVCIQFTTNRNLSVFCANIDEIWCISVLCSPQAHEKLIYHAPSVNCLQTIWFACVYWPLHIHTTT